MSNVSPKPKMDVTEEQAKVLIGKHILVGITHCNLEGTTVSLEQFHGIAIRANQQEGLVIKLNASNEERSVPLELSCLQITAPGQYRLTDTGEMVVDPDYTLVLTLYPEEHKG